MIKLKEINNLDRSDKFHVARSAQFWVGVLVIQDEFGIRKFIEDTSPDRTPYIEKSIVVDPCSVGR